MDRKIKTYLFDILKSIEELEDFFKGTEITIDTLLAEVVRTRAVERDLEIIGEAIKKILKIEPAFPISNSRQIIATRNFIAHEYGTISYENIVEVLKTHLPILKGEVQELISKE
jgi:uncharacterized protein with HEPN domain